LEGDKETRFQLLVRKSVCDLHNKSICVRGEKGGRRKGCGIKILNKMETVTLKIKSPSASISDLELEVRTVDTIIDVKEKICSAYPTHPHSSTQKLVYLGKILRDTDRLDSVLRFEEECTFYTFHLVCALPQKSTETTSLSDSARYEHVNDNLPIPDQDNIPPPATYVPPTTNQQTMEDMMRTFSTQYTAAISSLPSAPNQAEMAAMQELYNQYLGLYMEYMGGQTAEAQYQQLLAPPQQEIPPQGVQEAPQVPPVQGPGEGMVMNAGGGGAVAAEAGGGDRNRDVLDWVYVMTRVVLLFSVIYFHSSFLRLAFVTGLGFLVFLYQNRQNGRARRVQVAAPAPPQPQPEDAQEERGDDDGHEANEEEEEIEEPKPSRLAVVVTFFSSLISSIIPEQNQII